MGGRVEIDPAVAAQIRHDLVRIFPQLGYVVVGLSNLDPPAASELVNLFADRLPTD